MRYYSSHAESPKFAVFCLDFPSSFDMQNTSTSRGLFKFGFKRQCNKTTDGTNLEDGASCSTSTGDCTTAESQLQTDQGGQHVEHYVAIAVPSAKKRK